MRILFVCSGNTCRSPMAEAITRRRLAERGRHDVEVRSAGTGAVNGMPASGGARRATAAYGLDLDGHRSSRLSEDLVAWADLVLTMGAHHLEVVRQLGGAGKSHLLTEFAGLGDAGVPDPFGAPDSVYLETFEALGELVGRALTRVLDPGDS